MNAAPLSTLLLLEFGIGEQTQNLANLRVHRHGPLYLEKNDGVHHHRDDRHRVLALCRCWENDLYVLSGSSGKDLQYLTPNELKALHASYAHFLQQVGKSFSLHWRVVATAIVYFKRFYVNNSFMMIDPLLVAPTCLYIAGKIEETGMSHTRLSQILKKMKSAYTVPDIVQCEFYVLEDLHFDLIVFHPYRPLIQYCDDAKIPQLLPDAWTFVNDSYRTAVSLLHPPHLIALAALFMAGSIHNQDMRDWFAAQNVDMDAVASISHEIGQLYATVHAPADLQAILSKLPTQPIVPRPGPAPVAPAVAPPPPGQATRMQAIRLGPPSPSFVVQTGTAADTFPPRPTSVFGDQTSHVAGRLEATLRFLLCVCVCGVLGTRVPDRSDTTA
ncbi:putative g1/s-specific cyclin c [Paratrimastix pyriformis]|uniref:G1/s-specific cyclin c n=1 Tax=Paratrimastix pyriformis TaxID=342808 RepID=A0ABQ8UJJ7_9EUKA|nr:putative g1/s-specific cyclin c [Paratrimastix pyriformis]